MVRRRPRCKTLKDWKPRPRLSSTPAVEAELAEREAADRAKQAMEAAEARVDEAIAAYRVAVDAWRTLLE